MDGLCGSEGKEKGPVVQKGEGMGYVVGEVGGRGKGSFIEEGGRMGSVFVKGNNMLFWELSTVGMVLWGCGGVGSMARCPGDLQSGVQEEVISAWLHESWEESVAGILNEQGQSCHHTQLEVQHSLCKSPALHHEWHGSVLEDLLPSWALPTQPMLTLVKVPQWSTTACSKVE